jgi:hypothetical protein
MGKMEELEKGMTLLDKMRNSIGEEAYHAQVQDVLKAFPTFNTYHAQVDVIKIIDDPVDADSVSVTEPDLSKMRVAGILIPPKISGAICHLTLTLISTTKQTTMNNMRIRD